MPRPAVLLLAAPLLGSCAGAGAGVAPKERVAAIHAAEVDEAADLRRLVEDLEADDVVIRMTAIASLRDATGTDFGFDPLADPTARDAAIEAWVDTTRIGRPNGD